MALDFQTPDRPAVDLGATWVSGIAASTYAKLRVALGLPASPPRVHEPLQILGDVDDDVRQALGVDVAGIWAPTTIFGYRNDGWKPWRLQDGTPVLVSQHFVTTEDVAGNVLIHPRGDPSAPPSAVMPKGGFYFDAIVRQAPLDDAHLDPQDWADSFSPFDDQDLESFRSQADNLRKNTDYAIVANFGQGGLGDVASVPGVNLASPRGLRDPNLWYEYLAAQPEYIAGIFDLQTASALQNLELLRQAVGDLIDVVIISGTDFGSQRAPLVSPEMFRRLWKPRLATMNRWVHDHTSWKVFYHSCGSVEALLEDFIEIGVDILNPVQCTAASMSAQLLKDRYAGRLVFWGGGVDTQTTLPFGSPVEVAAQARERVEIFGRGGGYVFAAIHNVQALTPVENVIAAFGAVSGRPQREPAACE